MASNENAGSAAPPHVNGGAPPSPPLDHPPPLSPPLPPPPPTNSLALLLPHASLFAPPVLLVLRHAFEKYGHLAHWAPVRAMGRVIVVFNDDESAAKARELDGYVLDLEHGEQEYFSSKKPVLRVFPLPPTPLGVEPDHLRPPELERNFLISPPGSPPEGWEPIVEEGPNMAPLADDLRRALEQLQLGARGLGHGPEVILDGGEGGVRVEVEDTTREEGADKRREMEWGVEEPEDRGVWAPPSQEFGVATPSGSVRIMPTARPPM